MMINLLILGLFALNVSAAPQTRPITTTLPGQGMLEGYQIIISRTQRVSVFLGIPYAAPPLGKLRFAPPQTEPLVSWTGIRSATSPMPSCVQSPAELDKLDKLGLHRKLYPNSSALSYHEDCLYLNVYAPDGPLGRGQEGWPVVIYIHTTDFMSGSPYLMDPSIFAIKNKVVVVIPSFRLNVFGFLSTGDGYSQGNFGLMDQAAAIDWVQRSISSFNGTGGDVTLMGHGGGGASVTLHMMREGSGFHRAVALSGSALQPGVVRMPDTVILDILADTFECDRTPHQNLMACLRNAPVSYLLEKAMQIGSWGPVNDANLVNVTSPFIPDKPEILLQEGRFVRIPFISGFIESEESHSLPSDLSVTYEYFMDTISRSILNQSMEEENNETTCYTDEELLKAAVNFYYAPPKFADNTFLRQKLVEFKTYKNYGASIFRTAELISRHCPTYVYRFEYKIKTLILNKKENNFYLSHQSELPFIWGMPYWLTVPSIPWNSADKRMADQMLLLMSNFMKYTDPESKTQPVSWTRFTEDKPDILIISKDFNMADDNDVDYKHFSFWNKFFPEVQRAAYTCCNATNNAISTTANFALITVSTIYSYFYLISYLQMIFSIM